MKILIFGGNGMVGSSVYSKLSKNKDFEKIVRSTRNDTNLFSESEALSKVKEVKPDLVINCAAMVGGIVANDTKRFEFITNNLKINMNILNAIKDNSKIQLINLGSSCIYPLGAAIPISEDSLMTGKLEPTNSPYAMAKLAAIEIGDTLEKQYGHKVLNLMPTNLYGQNDNFSENESHVIPGLIAKMHKAKTNNNERFDVWGSGNPLREFLHVDDLSNAIEFLILNNINSGLFNVGSGEEVAIKDLSFKIKEVIEYKGEIYFDRNFPDGNPRKLLDITKLKTLGWKPNISLDSGLKQTYKWYLENKVN